MLSSGNDLPSDLSPESLARLQRRQQRQLAEFLRGPVPLWWLIAAAKLPGKALTVGLVLWFRRGIEKRSTIKLPPALLRRFGISRHAGYRALESLESAGLVAVERHPGSCPVVTLRDSPPK